MAWCYARASHEKQYDKKSDASVVYCDTVDRQLETCEAFYRLHLAPQGVLWGGHEADSFAVSASKTPFLKRPAAMRLMAKLQPGDHLIFDKVDRMWRKLRDYVHVDETMERMGVTMHIVNLMGVSATRGTPAGDLLMGIFVLVAQLESQMMGDRIRANIEWRKARGLPVSKKKYGYKLVKHGKQPKVFVDDLSDRAIGQEIIRLKDVEGKSWEYIADTIERASCAAEGRRYFPYKFLYELNDSRLRFWTLHKIKARYEGEKRLQLQERDGTQYDEDRA